MPGAIAQYERARKVMPDRINYARRLAVLYAQIDMDSDARREFTSALQTSPDDLDLQILKNVKATAGRSKKLMGELKSLKSKMYGIENDLKHL